MADRKSFPETYSDAARRRKQVKKAMQELAKQTTVLTDGSGIMSGIQNQPGGEEILSSTGQQNEQNMQEAVDKHDENLLEKIAEDEQRIKRQQEVAKAAKLERGAAELQKKKAKEKAKKDMSPEVPSTDIESGLAALDAGTKGGSDTGTNEAGDAASAALSAGAATSMNPWVMAGAAAISLISSGEKRKQARREAMADAKKEEAKGEMRVGKSYMDLATSIKGMLS
jgi:hypothetical protein